MDVFLVENHHIPVLCVVEWPLMRLAVRRFGSTERGVAGLGELYPQLAQGFPEGRIELSSGYEGLLRMIEYGRKLYGMSTLDIGYRGFSCEEIAVRLAAGICLVLQHSEKWRDKYNLIEQTACAGIFVANIFRILAVALNQRFLFFRQLGKFLCLAVTEGRSDPL